MLTSVFVAAAGYCSERDDKPVQADTDEAWGDLQGRFVWNEVGRAAGDGDPTGIADVFVFLDRRSNQPPPRIHLSYRQESRTPVVLAIRGGRWKPRAASIRTDQELLLINMDSVGYNPNLSTFRNPAQNLLLRPQARHSLFFSHTERLPIRVSGNIHSGLIGWLMIADHPYVAVTDEDGRFEIKYCPVGEWTFRLWNERAGYIRTAVVQGVSTELDKGRMKVHVQPNANQLGEIRVSRKLFE